MLRNSGLLALIVPFLLLSTFSPALGEWKWRTDNQFYKPMVANIRKTHLQMRSYSGSPVRFTNPKHAVTDHRFWDVAFGGTFEFGGFEFTVPKGKFKDGVSAFIDGSAHMLLDFSAKSNAVINTDFRIGGGLMGRYQVLAAKLRFFHECTHLGDEFVIDAIDQHPNSFQRYNVGYNSVELYTALDYHDIGSKKLAVVPLFKYIKYARIYTGILSLGGLIFDAGDEYEAYIGYADPALNRSLKAGTWEGQVGGELDFPFEILGFKHLVIAQDWYYRHHYNLTMERRIWSRNTVVGFVWGDFFRKGLAGSDNPTRNAIALLLTHYTGVNPHGQFRAELLSYYSVGISISF